jgi:hypothetical protein
VFICLPALVLANEPKFERIRIDDNFRAEGVAVGDFNKDGLPDIATGDYWYAAPDWKMSRIRQPLTQQHQPTDAYDGTKGYSNCFCSWSHDLNRDGWDDLIVVGYPGDPFYWYENPKNSTGDWKQFEIWHSACNETVLFTDITGDGRSMSREMEIHADQYPRKSHGKWDVQILSRPRCR